MTEQDKPRRSRRGSGAITLRDVAALAGVAPITASRVLNTPDQVSPEVRQRVLDAVERSGYVPNRMAGSLASARSRLIAAIVPSSVASVFMETVESLNERLFDAGYQLLLGQSNYSPEREAALLEALLGRRPDGIFLAGILPPGRARTRLLASGIPVVESWDLTPTPVDMLVGFSHQAIGAAVAHFFGARGRRRLAFIRADDERAGRRCAAFVAAAAQQGLDAVEVINVGAARTLASGRQALARLLEQAPGIDAICCSSDLLALGALTEARARGIAVPARIALMGFGDVPFIADMAPALSTVRINGAEIGRLAAQCLINRAEGREVDPRVIDIGFTLIERDTT